ncbi:MAG TPA: deoxynucleoside kinase [Gammaproteobacteria bacterium]|jgi:deoxyadenosine/deoxycytidine kinase|nr:deoxynucleoside kinase [Gammaproteobacteria bacterium]
MSTDRPGYIVVEGPIGVGKTSLARRLAESYESDLLLEGADENPFIERFYADPRAGALPTQLFFLFQRARQMEAMRQADMFQPVRVSDFLMEKDRLFAELTLDPDELKLYEQVYAHVTVDAPVPDLVIYLQAPVDILMKRIARRGIHYERRIDADYLQRLSEAYARMFLYYQASPLLIVNAAHINLVDSDADYNALLEQIHMTRKGVQYFNPMSEAI